jgi:hypothetical protein
MRLQDCRIAGLQEVKKVKKVKRVKKSLPTFLPAILQSCNPAILLGFSLWTA